MRATNQRAQVSATLDFPAPTKGWVQSGNIVAAGRDQAEVLDNFIPTAQGARLRGGIVEHADLGAACVQVFNYSSGSTETLFGATATDIYDTANVGGGAVRASLTSGDWSTAQISTSGGQFLVGVNGADTGWTYNGSFAGISLTGVTASDLSQVWLFKERLFFVEEATTSVWYLPVESIGGTVTEIDLGAVLNKGGNILFGATWSLDSGSGLDDVCVFVSSNGEIAVYEGTDPSNASTWSLVGVYDIGKPLNKHGSFRAGGDLAILTVDGIVPVSAAIKKDRAALQLDAITYPIEDAWRSAVANRTAAYPVTATLWQSRTMLLVGTPEQAGGKNISFAANARTGGWGRFTGWDVRCSAVSNDILYFGSNNGKVYVADEGGTDDDVQFTGIYVPKFATGGKLMDANAVSLTYRATAEIDIDFAAHGDYQVDEIVAPAVTLAVSGDVWGTGVWGTFVWGSGAELFSFTTWQAAYATGYSLAPSFAVTSNQVAALGLELLVARLRYETGYDL